MKSRLAAGALAVVLGMGVLASPAAAIGSSHASSSRPAHESVPPGTSSKSVVGERAVVSKDIGLRANALGFVSSGENRAYGRACTPGGRGYYYEMGGAFVACN